MLKMTTNKSANQLLKKKDRTLSDYLQLFNTRNFFKENNEEEDEEIYPVINEGYKRLYNLNKLNKEKEEDYRQKILRQRELNELSECSFFPKVNSDFEYKKENIFNNTNINNNQNLLTDKSSFSSKFKNKSEEMTDFIISDLLKRQEEWIAKKNKKIELNKQLQKNLVNKKLVFSPEINKINLDYMKIDAQEVVEDPESYKEFIDRNKKYQKNMEINNNNIGYINKTRNTWNKNIGNYNYDYTEHRLINKNGLNRNNKNYRSVDIKKQKPKKNMVYTKTKINKINNDDIYSLIYFENKEKYENRINEGFSEQEKKNIFNGKKQIEFKEALDILHDKLINLDLLEDDDNNDNKRCMQLMRHILFCLIFFSKNIFIYILKISTSK